MLTNKGFEQLPVNRLDALEPHDDKARREAMRLLRMCAIEAQYDLDIFSNKDRYTGPSDLEKCVCRFCNRKSPLVKFAHRNAHAIPDALGNTHIFCNDECVSCNHDLANVEKNLINYLNFRRGEAMSDGLIKRKRTIIGQNYIIDSTSGVLEISNEAIRSVNGDNCELKYLDANLISHRGIYRALCKIAIDLMPNDRLDDFKTTVEWIKGTICPHTVPDVYFAYMKDKVAHPAARLYMRKRDAGNPVCPNCIMILDLLDLRFFYIVPFAVSDGYVFLERHALRTLIPFLISVENNSLLKTESGGIYGGIINMDDRVGKFSHVIDSVDISNVRKTDRPEFKRTREKNPNKVDFPELDPDDISIEFAQLRQFVRCDDERMLNKASIEHCRISSVKIKSVNGNLKGDFILTLSFSIEEIISGKELFNTVIDVFTKHRSPTKVYSEIGDNTCEFSFHMVEHMIRTGIDRLEEAAAWLMPDFRFQSLVEFILENSLYVLPNDRHGRL